MHEDKRPGVYIPREVQWLSGAKVLRPKPQAVHKEFWRHIRVVNFSFSFGHCDQRQKAGFTLTEISDMLAPANVLESDWLESPVLVCVVSPLLGPTHFSS